MIESRNLYRTQSLQDAIPHHGCFVIKVHYLKGSSFAVPGGQREKLWQEFFMDPSQWWDHRSEKVSEHQTCQSSHVDGTIPLVVVNLIALSWLLSWSNLGRNSFEVLCTGGIVVVGWRR
jgi:hypothetical protein